MATILTSTSLGSTVNLHALKKNLIESRSTLRWSWRWYCVNIRIKKIQRNLITPRKREWILNSTIFLILTKYSVPMAWNKLKYFNKYQLGPDMMCQSYRNITFVNKAIISHRVSLTWNWRCLNNKDRRRLCSPLGAKNKRETRWRKTRYCKSDFLEDTERLNGKWITVGRPNKYRHRNSFPYCFQIQPTRYIGISLRINNKIRWTQIWLLIISPQAPPLDWEKHPTGVI